MAIIETSNFEDARATLINRINELKEQLAQEQGWAAPNAETVARLNMMIVITQRSLNSLPKV